MLSSTGPVFKAVRLVQPNDSHGSTFKAAQLLSTSTNPSTPSNSQEPVRTVLRIRPFLRSEQPQSCIQTIDSKKAEVVNYRDPSSKFCYEFDACFDAGATQDEIFAAVEPMIHHVFNGKNATVFAYGITGAGKTYTMDGTKEQPGVTPRALKCVFERIMKMKKPPRKSKHLIVDDFIVPSFRLTFAHLEIYNEKVFDLASTSRAELPVRQDADGNIVVADLKETPISNYVEWETAYNNTKRNRFTAATNLNAASSRSHSIIRITIQSYFPDTGKQVTGKLHLIDLAGSEDNRKTGNDKERMVESGNINKSLFMLGQVVEALNSGSKNIPYRNSKLTRLLQDSLGGRAVSMMITNVAAGPEFYNDTLKYHSFDSFTIDVKENLNASKPVKSVYERLSQSSDKKDDKRSSLEKGLQPVPVSMPKDLKRSSFEKAQSIPKDHLPLKSYSETKTKPSEKITVREPLKAKSLPDSKQKPTFPFKPQTKQELTWSEVVARATPNTKNGLFKAYINMALESLQKNQVAQAEDYARRAQTMCNDARLEIELESVWRKIRGEDQENLNENLRKLSFSASVSDQTPSSSVLFGEKEGEGSGSAPIGVSIREHEEKADRELLEILNHGTVKQITSVRGLGMTRAQQIIDYRMQTGFFASVNDLRSIGIGEKTLKSIRKDVLMKSLESAS